MGHGRRFPGQPPRAGRSLERLAGRRPVDLPAAAGARLPSDVEALDALPGVGAYTAGAVACFGGGAPVPFADTNVRRVLGRVLLGRTATEREAVEIDGAVMPRAGAARWHHALMDLGATVCVARAPRCDACPVFGACLARGADARPAPRRQAAFATSDRRIRGAIMKEVTTRRQVSLRTLRKAIPDERVPRLVEALASEGLVVLRDRQVGLPVR